MTVDFCTRIWNGRDPWADHAGAHGPTGDVDATTSAHESAMSCVEVAVLVGYSSNRLGIHIEDEPLLNAVNECPDHRAAVLGIDPTHHSALQRVELAGDHSAVIGIVLSPADQGLRPTDDRFVEVIRAASARGLIVLIQNPGLFHPRSDLAFADPRLIDEMLRDHHDDPAVQAARLVLGDLACVPIEHTLAVVAKHERVFVEMSAVAARPGRMRTAIFTAHEFGVAHRVLFASGFPRETPERAIERIYSLNTGSDPTSIRVPREALRQIVEADALGKLGIRHVWAGSGESKPRTPSYTPSQTTALAREDHHSEQDPAW